MTVETIDATQINVQDISASSIITQDISGNTALFLDVDTDILRANNAYIIGSIGIGKAAQNNLDVSGSASFSGNVSIGAIHGIHELDVEGHIFVQSDGSASKTFTQPGVHTIRIPTFVSSLEVELIGAGGFSSNGGGGGYIRGTVNVSGFGGQTLTLQVGEHGSGLCAPSSSSYLTFLPDGPLLTIAGAGGNGFAATALGVNAAGGPGGGGVVGISAGGAGMTSEALATAGAGGTSVGGAAAASPVGVIVYQTPQPGQGRPQPDSYIEANGGTGGFNESCGPAGGSGYAGGGQGLFGSTTSGRFLAGGGGGGSSFVSTYVSNMTSYAGGAVPSEVLVGFGRSNQNGCVKISYADIPSLQTSGDIVCGGNLRVDGQVEGPLDVSGTLSVDILNIRKYISDTNYTTAISTNIIRATSILIGTEDVMMQPQATLDVSGNAKIRGDISCNNFDAAGTSIIRSSLNVKGATTLNNGLQITAGVANVRTIEFATTSGTTGLYFDGLNLYFNGMMIEMTNPASYLLGMTAEYYRLPSGAPASFVPFARDTYGNLDYTLTKTISTPTSNIFDPLISYDSSLYLVVVSGWFKPSITDYYVFTTNMQYGQYSAYSDYYLYINGNILSGPTSATNSGRTLTAGIYYKIDVFFRFTIPSGSGILNTPISTQPAISWNPTTGAIYTRG